MPQTDESITRDANRVPIQSNEAFLAIKTIAFDGTANKGAVGTVPLFTVTGDVLAQVFGICSVDLVSTGGTGTLVLGITGNTTAFITTTTADTIDVGESWIDATPGIGESLTPNTNLRIVGQGADIFATVATNPVTAGTITFYCLWRPLSVGASVVPA